MASVIPETAKPPVKGSGGRCGGSAGGCGAQTPPGLGCPLLFLGEGLEPAGAAEWVAGNAGGKAEHKGGPGPQGTQGTQGPNPRKAPVRGFLQKSFCGEETSFLHMQRPFNSFLCCRQTTFSAAINHSPRSSPLARACRHPGTVPAGFGTSSDFGEICKTIFINNIRNFIFNNPVCKAKQGLSGGVVGGEASRLPKTLQKKML